MLALAIIAILGWAAPTKVRLRIHLGALKLAGQLPGVRPRELLELLTTRRGFDLAALENSLNPSAALSLPDQLASETDAGRQIFATHCAQCHGSSGEGGHGPALAEGPRHRSANDWAVFRVLQDGIPSTAMAPTGLSFIDTWKVIAYLRELQRDPGGREAGAGRRKAVPVTMLELAGADTNTAEWLSYTGGFSGQRNRDVPELTTESLGQMHLLWAHQFSADPSPSQTTPLAIRGLLIVTSAQEVLALDQRTGNVVWRFAREPMASPRLCCTRSNRGVAVLDTLVFVGTLDAHLIALDLATGRKQWDVAVGKAADGISITSAPLVVDGHLIVGVGGGDLGASAFLDAYEPRTGQRLWRFHTLPQAGEPGRETWPPAAAAPRGGATWVPGAYDPVRRLLYWGVGNPAPGFAPDVRPGDNLYTSSAIALDIDTGKLRWAFQFTPSDANDWDASQIPILVDAPWQGQNRALLLWANRNGFFYVLDRTTGEFLRATPFTRQTWNYGFEPSGRPKVRPSSRPTIRGAAVYPGIAGATSWWPATYSSRLGLMFVAIQEGGSIFFRDSTILTEDGQYAGGRTQPIPGENRPLSVVGLDLASGRIRWRTPAFENRAETTGGLLAIGDRIVLGGQSHTFFALDALSGERVWHANLGAPIRGAPIVFRVDGRLRLAIAAGSVLFVFDIPGPGSTRH